MIELSGLSSERREDVGVCDDWLSSLGWAALLVEEMSEKEYDSMISYYKGDSSKSPVRLFTSFCSFLKEKELL